MGFFQSLFSDADDNKLKEVRRDGNTVFFRGKGVKTSHANTVMEYLYRKEFFRPDSAMNFLLYTDSDFKDEVNIGYLGDVAVVDEDVKKLLFDLFSPLHILFPNRKIAITMIGLEFEETLRLGYAEKPI